MEQLVLRARQGDRDAWTAIVRGYEPLVRSVVRGYRLSRADAEDVAQNVWLRLFEHLGELREARALPGWIAVTTANLCRRELRNSGRTVVVDPHLQAELDAVTRWSADRGTDYDATDDAIVREQRRHYLQEGLSVLSPRQRQLLVLCSADPPVPYTQISRMLDMPVGSIGPTRARCLKKLRETEAVQALIGSDDPEARLVA